MSNKEQNAQPQHESGNSTKPVLGGVQFFSKAEAIALMQQGKLITHRWFSADEYMTMVDGRILLEDGVRCSPYEFWRWRTDKSWDEGYSLYVG